MLHPFEPEEVGRQQVEVHGQCLRVFGIPELIVVLILVNEGQLLLQSSAASLQDSHNRLSCQAMLGGLLFGSSQVLIFILRMHRP